MKRALSAKTGVGSPPLPLATVHRSRREQARDGLGLFGGRASQFIRDLRHKAAASADWLPSDQEAVVILAAVAEDMLKRAEEEGFQFASVIADASTDWLEMRDGHAERRRKRAKEIAYLGEGARHPLPLGDPQNMGDPVEDAEHWARLTVEG